MTNLLISTIRRHRPPTEPSGYIYTIDLEKAQVLQRSYIVEPAFREVDDNPRGGLRGGKGVSLNDDQIAIANYSMIFRYDPQWNLLGVITHPSCAAIHDIVLDRDTLWVTSARSEALMQYDISGNLLQYHYMRTSSPILKQLNWEPPVLLSPEHFRRGKTDFRDPRTHEKETHDNAHVNGVCLMSNGDILVSLGFIFGMKYARLLRLKIWLVKTNVWPKLMGMNKILRNTLRVERKNTDNSLVVRPARAQSAVVRIASDGSRSLCLVIKNVTAPSHSLLAMPDETVIYLNTTEGSVLHFEPQTCQVLSTTKVTDGFLRGVTKLSDQTIVVGSRGELITFDLFQQRVMARIKYSDDPNESVYDLKVLPDHYSLPPASFEEHFEEMTGYNAEEMLRNGYRYPVARV